jgi:hypothetical protein
LKAAPVRQLRGGVATAFRTVEVAH